MTHSKVPRPARGRTFDTQGLKQSGGSRYALKVSREKMALRPTERSRVRARWPIVRLAINRQLYGPGPHTRTTSSSSPAN